MYQKVKYWPHINQMRISLIKWTNYMHNGVKNRGHHNIKDSHRNSKTCSIVDILAFDKIYNVH